ncbi:ImuA family protein [Futiania mangrovi]|uniref:DNA repair protein n=1 Tax=Futiania mangrovi TaxID=2959716 RepID=A0A9J6PBX8_9PROT|nr:DNA repair protein [Futiania mangrovii]MCP1335726.1 DNA repair protein [Futiania mangrovii]
MEVADTGEGKGKGKGTRPGTRAALQAAVTRIGASPRAEGSDGPDHLSLGCAAADAALGGGLARGTLHEVYGAEASETAAPLGFAVALAARLTGGGSGQAAVWVRDAMTEAEAGRLNPAGLADLGLDPGCVVLVRAKDVRGVLRAGEEALACPGVGAAILDLWGEARLYGLTATRRLGLAAGRTGATAIALRLGAEPGPSAAATRWRIRAGPSADSVAGAPGRPAFEAALTRNRAGPSGTWILDWDSDGGRFRDIEAHARPVVSGPAGRPAAAAGPGGAWGDARAPLFRPLRRAG